MKRKVLILALVLFAAFSSKAQIVVTSTQAYNYDTPKPEWQRALGPFMRADVGLHFHPEDDIAWMANFAVGYQFTHRVSLSVGASYRRFYCYGELDYVPLFVELRFNATKGVVQPFVSLNTYYPVYSSTTYRSWSVNGLGFSADLGISIKYFNISAFFGTVPLQRLEYETSNVKGDIGVKIGLDIPIPKRK